MHVRYVRLFVTEETVANLLGIMVLNVESQAACKCHCVGDFDYDEEVVV